ncbi:SCO2322 family protein [Streptomyces marincola]|uniref:SCO2322 family protein n=1 Tax=Streptomyces marincola TaxID=2878388 RepID=UPI001CF454AB|nr:SCO2322 family protein [Streptomyces marincola]UCM87634.1 hypothetical protein LC193_06575 [Streptomyces marincola]
MRPGAARRRGRAVPRAAGRAAVLCGLLLAGAGLAPGAAADDGRYRYWSFWTWDAAGEQWSYATQGPGTLRPGDGDVLGFRFAESGGSADTSAPRAAGDFAGLCGTAADGGADTAADGGADAGGERVALVIDFGTARDAPDGAPPPAARTECAPLPEGATAAEVLAEVAEPLRYDAGALLCAIAGYPARGCADEVGDEAGGTAAESGDADATGGDTDGGGAGGSALAVLVGAGAVAALATAAVVRARRRES